MSPTVLISTMRTSAVHRPPNRGKATGGVEVASGVAVECAGAEGSIAEAGDVATEREGAAGGVRGAGRVESKCFRANSGVAVANSVIEERVESKSRVVGSPRRRRKVNINECVGAARRIEIRVACR